MEPVRVEARESDGRIQVDCDFRDKENIKEIPGHRWEQKTRTWSLPLSWAAMLQLRGVFGERLEVGPKLQEMAWQVFEHRVKPSMALRDAPDAQIDFGTADKLVPLQRAAAAFMLTAKQALVADPMGAGKTPVTLVTLEWMKELGLDIFPVLVVCPKSVMPHWKREAEGDESLGIPAWAPTLNVELVTGSAKKRREALESGADVLVVNWDIMAKHSRLAPYGAIRLSDKEKEDKELNGGWIRTVIADECHRAKDPKTKWTRALWAVGDRADYRFALTGTPVANTPQDLWSIMRFVYPAEYPSRTSFNDRYALLGWNPFGGLNVVGLRGDTREELFGFLDPRMIRRPKEVILPQLREKLPVVTRTAAMPHKQRKAYDQLREHMLAELDSGVLMASNPLQHMLRLRQLAGATGDIDENGDVTLTLPSGKIDDLLEMLEECDPTDKIAVFAESRKLIELTSAVFEKRSIEHRMITGGVSGEERETNRLLFQDSRSGMNVLLLTLGAGAEGLNLSQADVEVFLERSWSAVKNSQAEERAHRMGGSESALRIVDIVSEGTVDSVVHERYMDKLGKLQEVVRDEETLRKWLS